MRRSSMQPWRHVQQLQLQASIPSGMWFVHMCCTSQRYSRSKQMQLREPHAVLQGLLGMQWSALICDTLQFERFCFERENCIDLNQLAGLCKYVVSCSRAFAWKAI